jgi:uncharacterized protein YutE (UPF0331/DUF86 family)
MPPDLHFVRKSLSQIEESIRFLKTLAQRSEEDYLLSMEAKFSSAYALMTAIEGATGVAAHVIATTGFPTPKGAADSFQILRDQGVLSDPKHAQRLQDMARFRNLLVHRYWEIDYKKVWVILSTCMDDFSLFAADVLRYVENGATGGPLHS